MVRSSCCHGVGDVDTPAVEGRKSPPKPFGRGMSLKVRPHLANDWLKPHRVPDRGSRKVGHLKPPPNSLLARRI